MYVNDLNTVAAPTATKGMDPAEAGLPQARAQVLAGGHFPASSQEKLHPLRTGNGWLTCALSFRPPITARTLLQCAQWQLAPGFLEQLPGWGNLLPRWGISEFVGSPESSCPSPRPV